MERNFDLLHNDVAKGKAGGKIIWQPRIGAWYDERIFAGIPLPEAYQGKSLPEIYRLLGCSARPYLDYNKSIRRIEHPSVKSYSKRLNATDVAYCKETPVGTITEVLRAKSGISRDLKLKRRIQTPEDFVVAQWLEENCSWEFDFAAFEEARTIWGNLSAPTVYLPRINIQSMFIDDMGVEEGVYALYDYPDEVHSYLHAMDDNHLRLINDVVNKCPIDIINFGDNVHSSTLPPDLFEEFVLPAYIQRNDALHTAGKFTCAHWDGDTKPLLRFARQTGLDGIEAITPKPQGDVTLQEIKEGLGDMYLLDGVAAILFDPNADVDELLEQAEEVIKLFAPNLILGISDEISYTGDIERVRLIGDIVDKYNKNVDNK